MDRDAPRPSGAVDRGPPRAARRQRQLPRASLRHHRPRRGRRYSARHRLRGTCRCRRVLRLSVLGVPRGGAGREHSCPVPTCSKGTVPNLVDGDQQATDPPLSRRGTYRSVLRAGGAARHPLRVHSRWTRRAPPEESRPPGADAVRQHHREAFRQRRLPGMPAPRRRRDRSAGGARAAAARRARRAMDRRGLLDLLRAGGARHFGLRRVGRADDPRSRAGRGADDAERRAGAARRRAFPRPGARDHPGPGRARGPRHRPRQGQGRSRRYRVDAVLDRHLGLARDGDGRRRGGCRVRYARRADRGARRAPAASRARRGHDARRRGARAGRPRLARGHRAPVVLAAGEPAGGRGPARARGHGRVQATVDSGTFSYAAHACVAAVDPESGEMELLDYVVVEDGGVLVRPDDRRRPSLRRRRARHRHRTVRGDALRRRRAAARLDPCRLPSPRRCRDPPDTHRAHGDPVPYTRFGQKGIGEGGAIGPPAAIANAINDALAPVGAEVDSTPITMHQVLAKIMAAREGAIS